ncbi:MAG: hypothetical protein Kow0080_19270 [Candidatus Promineifilaceae bacterium]
MTTVNALEKNKALVHKFFHAYQSGQFDQIVASMCTFHSTLQPETAVFSQAAAQWRAAFANGRFQLNILIAEENKVAAQWHFTGTHQGRWPQATTSGQAISLAGITMFEVNDQRITAVTELADRLTLWEQLGLLPANPQTPAIQEITPPHYLEESLRAKNGGFAFNIQNPFDNCTLIGIPSFRVDNEAISSDKITLITMNGGIRPATAVSASSPLHIPANTTLRLQIHPHKLASGPHTLELVLELAELATTTTISFQGKIE